MNCLNKFTSLLAAHRPGRAIVDILISFLVILIFSVLFWGVIGSVSNWKAERIVTASSVEVHDYSYEREDTSDYLVGQVKNISDKDLEYVKVVFALYGLEGELMGTVFDHTYDLRSGETVSFRLLIPPEDEVKKYSLVFAEGWDPWK